MNQIIKVIDVNTNCLFLPGVETVFWLMLRIQDIAAWCSRWLFTIANWNCHEAVSAQWSKGVTKPILTFRRFWTFSSILITVMYDTFGFRCFLMEKKTLQKSWVKPLWKENWFLLHKIHFFIYWFWECTPEHAYALWF